VNRGEIVIEPEELDLVVDLKQRPLVPEPDILNRSLVLGRNLGVQHAQCRVAAGLKTLQAVSLAGQLDVAGKIRRLPGQFARLHDQPLDKSGDNASCQEVQSDPKAHGIEDQAIRLGVDGGHKQSCADQGNDGQKRADRKSDMVIRIADPKNRAGGREEKFIAAQPVTYGNQHKKAGAQNSQVGLDCSR
jgi:hypothetical protein